MAKKQETESLQDEDKKTGQASSLTQPAAQSLTTNVINFEEDAGAGQEGMGREDFAIPRLSILQALSPQVKKKGEAYIDGAEEGMIFDSVSQTLRDGDKGIRVVPITYRRTFIEWKTRENGGGFIADHGKEGSSLLPTTKRDDKGRDILPNGNQLVATAEYFVMVVNEDGSFSPYVLSMTGSQLKKSRQWNTMINQLRVPTADGKSTFNPAMFYSSYTLSTIPQSNNEGSWFGWKIAPSDPVLNLQDGANLYVSCRNLRASILSGEVQASKPSESSAHEAESDDSPM